MTFVLYLIAWFSLFFRILSYNQGGIQCHILGTQGESLCSYLPAIQNQPVCIYFEAKRAPLDPFRGQNASFYSAMALHGRGLVCEPKIEATSFLP